MIAVIPYLRTIAGAPVRRCAAVTLGPKTISALMRLMSVLVPVKTQESDPLVASNAGGYSS
jgi:hypothetical protein